MHLHFKRIGDGRPLIILHGLFGSSDNWQTIAKHFAEKIFAVYLVDQRNHGHSPHTATISYKLMADDLFQFVTKEKISTACVMGHSMGGKTAMQFALDNPDMVSKLIVVDMAPKYYPPHHREILDALLSVDLTKLKTRKEVEQVLFEKITDIGTRQFLLKNLYWLENEQLAWRFNLKVLDKEINNLSEAINGKAFDKPVLFIRGEKSSYISDKDVVQIKSHFPLAQVATAPTAGHWVHADNPKWLLETCLTFLRNTQDNV